MGSTSPQFLSDEQTVVYAVNGGNGFSSDMYVFKARNFVDGQLTQLSSTAFVGYVTAFTISSDGTTAAFATKTTTGTASYELYTQNLVTGASTRVTTQADFGGDTIDPKFSLDGRKLVFLSGQPDLVDGDTNGVRDAFVKDLTSGSVTRVSTASDGSQASASSIHPFFTADGNRIVFSTTAGNLVAGDANGLSDVFIKDLRTGAIDLVPNTTGYKASAISADGSKILLEDTLTSFPSLYSLDTKTDVLTLVSSPVKSQLFGSIYNPL